MNQRIKELAEQAGAEIKTLADGTDYQSLYKEDGTGFDLEKFAELIVKETMQVVANRLPSNVYLDVADAVIEHYGDK
jgi:hypothetical protein